MLGKRKKRFWALLLLIILMAFGLLFFYRSVILQWIGDVLLVEDQIGKPADLIVVVRGGSNFERLLEAFDLYQGDKGKRIVIARALGDQGIQVLERLGVQKLTEQEEYKDILLRLGVPERSIILDKQRPGGGTYGEALRIKRLTFELEEVKRIMVVTSWWHTRKTRTMYRKVFEGSGVDIMVRPALKYAVSKPSNWWEYRYEALAVFTEYVKLVAYLFRDLIGFRDDYPQRAGGMIEDG